MNINTLHKGDDDDDDDDNNNNNNNNNKKKKKKKKKNMMMIWWQLRTETNHNVTYGHQIKAREMGGTCI